MEGMTFTYLKRPYNGDPAAERNMFIGGSDAGTILGLNPYKSPYTLWCEKTGRITPDDISDKESVWWGNYDEEGVAQRFCMKAEKKVTKSNFTYYLQEYPYIAGHIDRRVVGEQAGLECKTTSSWNHTRYDEGDIPPIHYAQCQHYMLVTGWKYWYYAVKKDNTDFFWMRIDRNEEYIRTLLRFEIEFWAHVLSNTPPGIDGSASTGKTLDTMYSDKPEEKNEHPIILNSADAEELVQINDISHQIDILSDLKNAKINAFKDRMGYNPLAEGCGFRIKYKATRGRETIDAKRLKKECPDIYEEYKKVGSPTKRFVIEKMEEY